MIQQLTGTDEAADRCCLIGLQVLIKRLTGADRAGDKAMIKGLTGADPVAYRC